MSRIDKETPSTRPSAARRMARVKVESIHRARAKRRDDSCPEVPQALPVSTPDAGPATARTPVPWSPDLYEVERATYARRKPDLLREAPGKFVVFVGETMIGPFDDRPSALKAAYRTFGVRSIYVRQVLAEEPRAETGASEVCPY